MTKMDKEYIEKEYEQAIKEYNAVLTEDDFNPHSHEGSDGIMG